MAAKDLNLLTDPDALAAWARDNALTQSVPVEPPPAQRTRPRADLNAVDDTVQSAAKPTARQQAAQPSSQPSPPPRPATAPAGRRAGPVRKRPSPAVRGYGILAVGVAIINMAFLVLAGLWLTGMDLPGQPFRQPPTTAPALGPELAAVNGQLESLGGEIADLRRELASLRGSTAQPATEAAEPTLAPTVAPTNTAPASPASAVAPAPALEEPTAAAPAPPVHWQVNLGDYSLRRDALATQRRLAALGLESQIRQVMEAGRPVFLVTLENFARREDAESVANDIMVQTELNGLWVARSR